MSTGIGQRIKERRKKLGLSQEELATRLGLKSKSTICKIERGVDNLTNDSINKYAEALNTTPYYIMGYEDDEGNILVDTVTIQKEAIELYALYKKATPDIQAAVGILLKLKGQSPVSSVPHSKKDIIQ